MAASLRIPVTDLRRRLGTRRDVSRRTSPSAVADLAGVAGTVVDSDGEIALDLTIESVPEGVMVVGALVAPWSAECRRCLGPVTGDIHIDVHELFEHDPTPGDTYPLDDDALDLEPMVRDLVLLSLPLSVLCGDDCQGPDPERFPTVVADEDGPRQADDDDSSASPEADAGAPTGDPRWAALGELRFDD